MRPGVACVLLLLLTLPFQFLRAAAALFIELLPQCVRLAEHFTDRLIPALDCGIQRGNGRVFLDQ